MACEMMDPGDCLAFGGSSLTALAIELRWTGNPASILSKGKIDLDLVAMVDAGRGVTLIQPVQNVYGSYSADPYVELDRDDRAGGVETMRINLARFPRTPGSRIIIATYVYGDDRTWEDVDDATVTIKHQEGDFGISLRGGGKNSTRWLLDIVPNEEGNLSMTAKGEYFSSYLDDIDAAIGWPGLSWHRVFKN